MIAIAIVAGLAVLTAGLVATNALNQSHKAMRLVRESELSMRTHLQAQVDDLHAKVLTTNWQEYGSTVGQRSAFDRTVAAEAERAPNPFGDGPSFDEALERMSGETYDPMEGSVIG